MADAFRQMQKTLARTFVRGKHPYGCTCCRVYPYLNKFKAYSRKIARKRLKRMSDELLTARK